MTNKEKSTASAASRTKARADIKKEVLERKEAMKNSAGYYRNAISGGTMIVTTKKPSWLKRALVKWLLDMVWYENE